MSSNSSQLNIFSILNQASDPCSRKHGGNPQSEAAHKRVVHSKAETYKKILEYVESVGKANVRQIAEALGYKKEIHKISGRLSELKMMKPPKLRKVGVEDGAAVLEVVK